MQVDIETRLCSNLFDGENFNRKPMQSFADGSKMPENQILAEFCFIDIDQSFKEAERHE